MNILYDHYVLQCALAHDVPNVSELPGHFESMNIPSQRPPYTCRFLAHCALLQLSIRLRMKFSIPASEDAQSFRILYPLVIVQQQSRESQPRSITDAERSRSTLQSSELALLSLLDVSNTRAQAHLYMPDKTKISAAHQAHNHKGNMGV